MTDVIATAPRKGAAKGSALPEAAMAAPAADPSLEARLAALEEKIAYIASVYSWPSNGTTWAW